MNEVTVTVLPHPVTMFFIGAMLLGLVLVFLEFRRTRDEVRVFQREIQTLRDQIESIKDVTNRAVQEVSRKVDSRIDKALGPKK
jgi:hypothetical protein